MSGYKNSLPVPNLIYHSGVNENGLHVLLQFEPSTSPKHQFLITLVFEH